MEAEIHDGTDEGMETSNDNDKKRMEKARARKEKGDRARVIRVFRLIRRGATSRAGKALESKGLGDLTNGIIWEQITAKHPERKRQIPERAWTHVP